MQKLQGISFLLRDEPYVTSAEVMRRAQGAFDVDAVTRRFFEEFERQHSKFLSAVEGIRRVTDREWYASIMLNRLMFIYFIQRKGFLNGDRHYLRHKFDEIRFPTA